MILLVIINGILTSSLSVNSSSFNVSISCNDSAYLNLRINNFVNFNILKSSTTSYIYNNLKINVHIL